MRAALSIGLLLLASLAAPASLAPGVCLDQARFPPDPEVSEACGEIVIHLPVYVELRPDELVVFLCEVDRSDSEAPDRECREIHIRYARAPLLLP